MAKQTGKFIRLMRPGVKACGPYEAGKVYAVGKEVDEQEADRLVKVKGFEYVSDAQLASEKAAAQKAAAYQAKAAQESATTEGEQTQGGE